MSTLDLASGYWSVPIREEDKQKTAFITHKGLYEYNIMPYGLSNAPAVFSRLMDAVTAGLKWQSVLTFIDDILVYSKTFDDHLVHLVKLFERLRKANLTTKPSKCHFCRPKLIYLGHEISPEEVKPDPAKITALNAFELSTKERDGKPRKSAVKKIQSFLGLAQYYRKFIRNYSILAKPLTELTRESTPWHWSTQCQQAFETIKEKLSSAPLLAYPDFTQPFVIQTDACKAGLGAVLCQNRMATENSPAREVVIAFASRALTPDEAKWTGEVKEWEALAIVWACELFRHYLVGRKFVIQTDHANLQWLLQQKNGRLERWAMRLLEFDFLLQFKPGKANANADALSRHPWTGEPQSIEKSTSLQPLLFSISGPENLTNAQWQDPQLSKILRIMGATPPTGIQHTLEPSDAQQSDEISDPSQNSSPSASKTPNAPAKGFSADQNKLSEIYEVVDNQLRFHGHASP